MVENNLIEYHKGYISVSLGCIPSPEGGSVLCRYTYDSTQYADLTPKEIVEKAWKQYYEELNNLD